MSRPVPSPPVPARYMLLLVYVYLFWLAGQRVNYALENVENKFDVARTLGGALMCLTVPLATYQVQPFCNGNGDFVLLLSLVLNRFGEGLLAALVGLFGVKLCRVVAAMYVTPQL